MWRLTGLERLMGFDGDGEEDDCLMVDGLMGLCSRRCGFAWLVSGGDRREYCESNDGNKRSKIWIDAKKRSFSIL